MDQDSKKLAGKVAVVTGASKGIGAEIARELAREGASVVVNYASSKEGAERVVAAIQAAGGTAIAVGADLAVPGEIDALFAATKERFGRVDVLVNNAGKYAFSPLDTLGLEAIRDMFDVNVTGLLLATKAAVSLMPASGGSVINIGSVMAEIAPPMSSIYIGTKGAINSITRGLAKELAPRKIRVNALNPGGVETEGTHRAGIMGSDFEKAMIAQTPLGRIGQPGDIAPVVAFLASDDARWITGSLIDVAGGMR